MYSVYTTRFAETDIIEASFWYSVQRDGLEKDFFICVEAAINVIKRNPLLFSELNTEGIRKANTQKFPYGIYFWVNKNDIIIVGVLHLKENPDKWKSRKTKD